MYYYSGIQLIELAKESQCGKPGQFVPWNQALVQRVFKNVFWDVGFLLFEDQDSGF